MGRAETFPPPVEHRLEPGRTGRVQTVFVGCCSVRWGIAVVAADAAAGAAAAAAAAVSVAVAVAAAADAPAAAAATAVAALWPPASPLAAGSAERPRGARRGHAVTTAAPPPALGPAHLLRCLPLQLLPWFQC